MAGLRLDLGKIDKELTEQLASEAAENEQQHQQELMDPLSDDYCPDDHLTPVEKVEKYFQSEEVLEREVAVRCLIDASYFVNNYSDFELILEIVCALSSDHEPLIRIGILSIVSSLIERNTEFREKGDTPFGQENEDRLYEIPVKMLNDFNQQVRRISHNSVVLLLEEHKSKTIDSLVSQLCPMIKKCLGRDENYDLRMDTVMLISRVAPYLGQSICITHFVPLLPPLASDAMFHVRKSFATCCKDLCPAVGGAYTEEFILPYFLQLCKDEVWGVRKACADVFMEISMSCSLLARQERLTPVFLHLLKDDSRWVRKAAYQVLGPFISTFHMPPLYEESIESLGPLSDTELFDTSLLNSSTGLVTDVVQAQKVSGGPSGSHAQTSDKGSGQPKCSRTASDEKGPSSPSHAASPLMIFQTPPGGSLLVGGDSSKEAGSDEFGLFQFWRSPILPLEGSEIKDEIPGPPVNGTTQNGHHFSVKNQNISPTSNALCDQGLKKELFEGVVKEDEIISSQYEIELKDEYDADGLTDIKDELLAESEGSLFSDGPNDVFTVSDDVGGVESKFKLIQPSLGTTPNGFPQVRVFVHNTTGQIHEEVEEMMSGRGYANQSMSFHQQQLLNTTTESVVAMEMTLTETVVSETPYYFIGRDQEVVPDELIEAYLGMTDPIKAQNIDADLPLYCAFSFPAVLKTLGANHWSLLKPTFDILSNDVQWKIRKVLAHSIHELARILGKERTINDLLTLVDEYSSKDLDDIKMGILVHLAEFFEILPTDVRKQYFPSILNGLLDTENERNWRYRNSLAEQLALLCDQFDNSYIEEHIVQVAINLGYDKVSQVRESASNLIGIILQKFSKSNPSSCSMILKKIKEAFGFNDRWLLRLMYIKQCELFLQRRWISCSLFSIECLPVILSLSSDLVPNIRLAVGRLLHRTVLQFEFFTSNYSLSTSIQTTVAKLRDDSDRDVRYYSGAPLDPYTPPTNSCQSNKHTHISRARTLSDGSSTTSSEEMDTNVVKFDIAEAVNLLSVS